MYDFSTGALLRQLSEHYDVTQFTFAPNGSRFALTSSYYSYPSIAVCDTKLSTILVRFKKHFTRIAAIEFSPDSRFVVSASVDYETYLWYASTGVAVRRLRIPSPNRDVFRFEGSVSFFPDGKLLLFTDLSAAKEEPVLFGFDLTERSDSDLWEERPTDRR